MMKKIILVILLVIFLALAAFLFYFLYSKKIPSSESKSPDTAQVSVKENNERVGTVGFIKNLEEKNIIFTEVYKEALNTKVPEEQIIKKVDNLNLSQIDNETLKSNVKATYIYKNYYNGPTINSDQVAQSISLLVKNDFDQYLNKTNTNTDRSSALVRTFVRYIETWSDPKVYSEIVGKDFLNKSYDLSSPEGVYQINRDILKQAFLQNKSVRALVYNMWNNSRYIDYLESKGKNTDDVYGEMESNLNDLLGFAKTTDPKDVSTYLYKSYGSDGYYTGNLLIAYADSLQTLNNKNKIEKETVDNAYKYILNLLSSNNFDGKYVIEDVARLSYSSFLYKKNDLEGAEEVLKPLFLRLENNPVDDIWYNGFLATIHQMPQKQNNHSKVFMKIVSGDAWYKKIMIKYWGTNFDYTKKVDLQIKFD